MEINNFIANDKSNPYEILLPQALGWKKQHNPVSIRIQLSRFHNRVTTSNITNAKCTNLSTMLLQ